MKTPGTIIMLPTEKASQVYLQKEKLYSEEYPDKTVVVGNQFLYIISDDKIKEDDWYFDRLTNQLYKASSSPVTMRCFKKIIATTDTLVIKTSKSMNKDEFPDIIVPQISELGCGLILEYYNEHKRFPKVVLDTMEDPISIFIDEEYKPQNKHHDLLDVAEVIDLLVICFEEQRTNNHSTFEENKAAVKKYFEKKEL